MQDTATTETAIRSAIPEPEQRQPELEPLDAILSRMGLVPFSEDRIRRLELGVGEVALRLAEMIDHITDLALRIEQLEHAVGELRRERDAA